MRDDDVPAEIGSVFVSNHFFDDAIEHAEDVIMRHEGGFLTLEICVVCAVGEGDAGCLSCRVNVHGCDVATTVEPFPTIARPAGLAVIRVHAGVGKESTWFVNEEM